MTTGAPADLVDVAGARRARKRPVRVEVEFAADDGSIPTAEGEVNFVRGDALLTGAAGDRWPVPRARFVATYEAIASTPPGGAGAYRKRPADVLALRMAEAFTVSLSGGRGGLSGAAGDWLVQYAPGDQAVVAGPIFTATYELLD